MITRLIQFGISVVGIGDGVSRKQNYHCNNRQENGQATEDHPGHGHSLTFVIGQLECSLASEVTEDERRYPGDQSAEAYGKDSEYQRPDGLLVLAR